MKHKKILSLETTCMEGKGIILGEIREDTYCMISLICETKKKKNQVITKEIRFVVTIVSRVMGGENWRNMVKKPKLPIYD